MALQPRGHMVVTNDILSYRFELDLMPNGEFNFRLMYREIFIFALFNLVRENVVFTTYDRIAYAKLYMMFHSYEFVAGMLIVCFRYAFVILVFFRTFQQQLFVGESFSRRNNVAGIATWTIRFCTSPNTYNVSSQSEKRRR